MWAAAISDPADGEARQVERRAGATAEKVWMAAIIGPVVDTEAHCRTICITLFSSPKAGRVFRPALVNVPVLLLSSLLLPSPSASLFVVPVPANRAWACSVEQPWTTVCPCLTVSFPIVHQKGIAERAPI